MIKLNKFGWALLAGTACVPQMAGAQEVKDGANQPKQLEEILVTATRRVERIHDANVAVSALSSEFLDSVGAQTLQDYFALIPSMSSASNSIGERGGKNIIIRGVSNTRTNTADVGALAATTAFYINDIPITPVDTNLFDVERIEVLRGPQGTLYGAASMGGAVKLIQKRPDLYEFGGSAEASYYGIKGGDPGKDIKGVLNVPIFEGVFGLRFVGAYQNQGGYIDKAIVPLNNTTGSIPSLLSNVLDVDPGRDTVRLIKNANSMTSKGASVIALYTPNDALTVQLSALWQNTAVDDLSFVNRRFNGRHLQEEYMLEPNASEVTLTSLNVNYDFGPVNLVSNTGYYTRRFDERVDYTMTVFNVYRNQLDYVPAPVALETVLKVESLTQEIRLESKRDQFSNPFLSRLDWVAGLFWLDSKRPYTQNQDGYGWSAAAPTVPLPLPNDMRSMSAQTYWEDNKSAFVDFNYHITDKLAVGAGIRFFESSMDRDGYNLNQATGARVRVGPYNFSESGHSVRFGASYDFTEDTKVFVSYADGFRLGGSLAPINFNTSPQCVGVIEENNFQQFATGRFKTDKVETYEIGLKQSFANRRATLNLSAYRTDWSDLQQALALGNFSNICSASLTVNMGSARIDGAELEFAALATDKVTLRASLSYTDAYVVDPGVFPTLQVGARIQQVPEWTGSLVARYETPTNALGGGTFFVQGDMQYVDDRPRAPGAIQSQISPAYTLFNARAGVSFGDKPTTVTLWWKNISDEFVVQNNGGRLGVTGQFHDVMALPSTFGLTLSKAF